MQMVTRAIENGQESVHIILSHTIDNKNPLSCSKKREIINELTKGIRGINVIIVCMDDPTDVERCGSHPILKSICHAISHATSDATSDDQYTKAILFIGDDRASSYHWIGTALAKNNPPIELELVPLDRKVNPISATKIRDFVKDGDQDGFINAYQDSGLDEGYLDDLFSHLTTAMRRTMEEKEEESVGKKKKKNKKSSTSAKYTRKKSSSSKGGKKRRKRNSSNKRNKSFR
jgi:hypothetical protein